MRIRVGLLSVMNNPAVDPSLRHVAQDYYLRAREGVLYDSERIYGFILKYGKKK